MTHQQKLLWEKLTKEVRDSGMDNFHARELYDELSKLLNMEDRTIIAINVTGDGLEVRMTEDAYGNLGLIGLLEKIKINLLQEMPETKEVIENNNSKQKYDA
jgi:hypothetical protein